MKHITSFNEYNNINEGLFDKLFSWMKSIGDMFRDPQKIQKSVDAAVTENGKLTMFDPKKCAIKETYFVTLGDGKNTNNSFSISITKMADLFDGSGLFQITGTTNSDMLKSLTGTNNVEDLTKDSVMAIVSKNSFVKGKPISIKILKNILPGGKDYISKFVLTGIAPGVAVQKIYNKNK